MGFELTREQAAYCGVKLREILNEPAFTTAVEVTREYLKNAVMETTPDQQAKRNEAYFQYHALDNLLGTMNSLVFAALQLEAEYEDDINPFE